ncbi:MAG: cytidine deaminase [Lachnospiraceae bacterium]|nr:cytidine deaminase [Lachnospiraceae bacterium]
MKEEGKKELIKAALAARERAYIPYSGYAVGAAVLMESNRIYTGCNVENASYGATNCAERTALFKAVSEGERKCMAIAIAGGKEGKEPVDYAHPCGICRQVMREFGGEDLIVLVAKSEDDYREYTLKELLPYGFGGENLL